MSRVILFQPRFHAAILDARKTQTIRRPRKRPIVPGEGLSLRAWEGKPYRSRQRPLLETTCRSVLPIEIGIDSDGALQIASRGLPLGDEDVEKFARHDGFTSSRAMALFWHLAHGLAPGGPEWRGVVIFWEAPRPRRPRSCSSPSTSP